MMDLIIWGIIFIIGLGFASIIGIIKIYFIFTKANPKKKTTKEKPRYKIDNSKEII